MAEPQHDAHEVGTKTSCGQENQAEMCRDRTPPHTQSKLPRAAFDRILNESTEMHLHLNLLHIFILFFFQT